MPGMVMLSGILSTLSLVFKHGKREDVSPLAPTLLSRLGDCSQAISSNTQLRKKHTKLVQCLGVTFLPPRVASWRYQRGGRSLEEALATPNTSSHLQQVR